jgi:hypothetical protein
MRHATRSFLASSAAAVLLGSVARSEEGNTENELRALRERVQRLEQKAGPAEAPAAPSAGQPHGVLAPVSESIEVTGEVRVRNECRNVKDYKSIDSMRAGDDYTLLRTRLNVNATITDWLGARVGIQDSRTFGEEASPTSDEAGVDLHEGYLELRLRSVADVPLMIRVGRQEIRLGAGRLVAERQWSNAGQAFDGLHAVYEAEVWQAHAFIMTVKESTGSIDDDRLVTGLHATCNAVEKHTFDAYLYHRRYSDETFTGEKGKTGDLRDATFGLRGIGKQGGLDYEGEIAYQVGERGKDDVRAWMAVARVGYTVQDLAWKPRLGVEYDFASGDEDPSDGVYQGFDDLFGLRHWFLGIADYTGRSNLHDVAIQTNVEPVKDFTLQTDFHWFHLAEAKDAWRASDLSVMRRDASGKSNPNLALELDFVARYKAAKHFDFQTGAAWFFAGPYVEDTTGRDKDAWWCYLMVIATF